jgi:hypothetical protein
MTGMLAAFLTGVGICLVLFGTIAGLAIADFPAAVAVTAGLGVTGVSLYLCDRWRFRRHGPWFPALTELWFLVVALRGENRAARPRWTRAELDALRAKASLAGLLDALPRAQRERRPR